MRLLGAPRLVGGDERLEARACARRLGRLLGLARRVAFAGLVGRRLGLAHASSSGRSSTTATAAASSREWVIDSSICPAPVLSA